MGNSSCQPTYGFHFLCLTELFLQLVVSGDILCDAGDAVRPTTCVPYWKGAPLDPSYRTVRADYSIGLVGIPQVGGLRRGV